MTEDNRRRSNDIHRRECQYDVPSYPPCRFCSCAIEQFWCLWPIDDEISFAKKMMNEDENELLWYEYNNNSL